MNSAESSILDTIYLPVAQRFINIVGEIAQILLWAYKSNNDMSFSYDVHEMQLTIENDTFCKRHFDAQSYKSFIGTYQMCGCPLVPALEIKRVIKLTASINF